MNLKWQNFHHSDRQIGEDTKGWVGHSQYALKCLWTCNISSIWKHVRNAESQSLPGTTKSESTFEQDLQVMQIQQNLRSTALNCTIRVKYSFTV